MKMFYRKLPIPMNGGLSNDDLRTYEVYVYDCYGFVNEVMRFSTDCFLSVYKAEKPRLLTGALNVRMKGE